jgi:hypothetical protein
VSKPAGDVIAMSCIWSINTTGEKERAVTMITMLEYRGFKITTNGNPDAPEVKVFLKNRYGRALFETTSLDLAMQWIDRADLPAA